MKTQSIAAFLLITTFLPSCSLFAPGTQSVTVNSTVPAVSIMANGENKGTTPVTFEAKTSKSLQLIATKSGYNPSTYTVDRKLSKTAMLDIVGGIFLAVPFFGLLGDGAWELEQNNVIVPISR